MQRICVASIRIQIDKAASKTCFQTVSVCPSAHWLGYNFKIKFTLTNFLEVLWEHMAFEGHLAFVQFTFL